MLRLIELQGDLGGGVRAVTEAAAGLRRAGEPGIAEEVQQAASRAWRALERLDERVGRLRAEPCPECGAGPVELLGESCERAVGRMPVQDYYGSVSVAVGAHELGWRCAGCGAGDSDPCIHD